MKIDEKFRAWNRIIRRFQYFTLPDLQYQPGKIQWQNLDINKAVTLEGYNGQEVYEGDILDHSEGYCKVVYDEKAASFEVVFSDEANLSFYEAMNWGRDKPKVVGNIYENIDLLK